MADALNEADAPPPVPGFWRLGWLFFMQPLTLHRLFAAWGLEDDPPLWKLRGRLKEGDSPVRTLVARLGGWLLLLTPASTGAIVGSLDWAGVSFDWNGVLVGAAVGVTASSIVGVGAGLFAGIATGVAFGAALGVAGGIVGGGAFNVADGAAAGVAIGVLVGTTIRAARSVVVGFVGGVAEIGRDIYFSGALGAVIGVLLVMPRGFTGGFAGGFAESVAVGVAAAVSFGLACLLALFRLPLYLVDLTVTSVLRLTARLHPASLPRVTFFLPFRHHDLIYLPLPFLASLLVRIGEENPAEGRRVLAEAAASLGQKRPARRALVELQARSLERAAWERRYASASALALPFLPAREGRQSPQAGYLASIDSIAAAAQDLEAARSTGSHHRRRQALNRAKRELQQTLDRFTLRHLTGDERRFLPVIKVWLDRVEDEEAALAALEREQPQVPLVFVAGPALTPTEEGLFVGRTDLVRLLDQDLAAERPVPLVLLGQRRMGKSTLVNFLPRLLGTGTRVVCLNFQELSGKQLGGAPHRWVASEVTAALAGEKIEAPSAPTEDAPWGATLDWLAALEEPLATAGRRLLIALDEVEGLERGIREGWSNPAFLDFLRAAGDRLRRIRFLLVTARPFSRLGPHWSDRLISAQTRRIEPLAEEEARMLLTKPVAGFPDIYPAGGVERLLAETACHPYLLQLSAYLLTRRLNEAGRLKATDEDLTAALDHALEENNLFQNLWDDLTADEQRLLAALARGEEQKEAGGADETLSQARRELARERLIQQDGQGWRVAVPLFSRWIREIGAAG